MKSFTIPALAVSCFAIASYFVIAHNQHATAQENAASGPASQSRAYLHSYNLPASGVALEGYCPVAYFAVNKPVKGKPQFASTYNDVTYHFVSADAKQAFDASPQKFLPAYGGWCAFGMVVEDKFPVDPRNFKIVDGKLLLFLKNKNVDALKIWNDGDEQGNLTKAAAHWKKVQG